MTALLVGPSGNREPDTVTRCEQCKGYRTISRDAVARWNGHEHELSAVYDEGYCDHCGEKARWELVPESEAEGACEECGFTDGRHAQGEYVDGCSVAKAAGLPCCEVNEDAPADEPEKDGRR